MTTKTKKKERLLFGVTRLANGEFMVTNVYLRQDDMKSVSLMGIYPTLVEANMWYRENAPSNTTVR